MQPHSMCAVALSHYLWNDPYQKVPKSFVMNVEYHDRSGNYKLNKYELSNVSVSTDRYEFTVYILRGGGGIACSVTVKRNTLLEGGELELYHSENHLSGLREVYTLMKDKIRSGRHYNSQMYKNFVGEQMSSDRKKLRLWTEVKHKDGSFKETQYDLEIVSVS